MRPGKCLLMLLAMLFLPFQAIFADIPINERVSLDGSLRFRGFLDERDFDTKNTDASYYATMRTMIGFKIQATDDVLFRFKARDSRYLGVPYSSKSPGDPAATTLNSRTSSSLALQEGYIHATNVLNSGVDFQVGRFEMEYGRGRILGSNGWEVEGPRAYDGFRLMWHEPSWQFDLFATIIRDYSFGSVWPDFRAPEGWKAGVYQYKPGAGYNQMKRYLGGITASFHDGVWQPMLLVDFDSFETGFTWDPEDYTPGVTPTSKEPQLWATPALYTNFSLSEDGGSHWEMEGDFAGQFGQTNETGASPGSYNLLSFLAAIEVRAVGNDDSRPFIGAGFDVTGRGEGDDDPHESFVFYQYYYSQHEFRGLMDYFWNVSNGLIDTYLTLGARPVKWMELRLDAHNFRYMTSQGRVKASGKVVNLNQLGQEIDLAGGFQVKKGFYLDLGGCVFLPDPEFAARVNGSAFLPGPRVSGKLGYYSYIVFTTMF